MGAFDPDLRLAALNAVAFVAIGVAEDRATPGPVQDRSQTFLRIFDQEQIVDE
ncbi:MAG: hypothetical protein U1F61_11330 [Opitutaceae bacterium]